MRRFNLRTGIAVAALFLVGLALLVLSQGPGGITGLFSSSSPEERADQVLAGIKAENPYLALMEERQPEVYADLRATLIEGAANGDPVLAIANEGRQVIIAWLSDSISKAPDAIALEMLSVTADQFRELQQTNPQMCAAMVMGRPFGDTTPFLSDDLQARERAVYEALVTTPADPGVVSLPQAEVDAAFQQISPQLQDRFGADLDLMRQDSIDEADSARVCEIQIAILDLVQELFTPERAAAIARAQLGRS